MRKLNVDYNFADSAMTDSELSKLITKINCNEKREPKKNLLAIKNSC